MPAGVRATFTTGAERLIFRYRCDDESCSPVDLLVDGELVVRHATRPGVNEVNLAMPTRGMANYTSSTDKNSLGLAIVGYSMMVCTPVRKATT